MRSPTTSFRLIMGLATIAGFCAGAEPLQGTAQNSTPIPRVMAPVKTPEQHLLDFMNLRLASR